MSAITKLIQIEARQARVNTLYWVLGSQNLSDEVAQELKLVAEKEQQSINKEIESLKNRL